MRKDLEDLIFVGQLEETFKMFGKTWKIRTLTSEEQIEATASTAGYDNLARINALKIEILGYALTQIDNVELNDPEETVEFIKKLPTTVVNSLFAKYEELQDRQDKVLEELDELKN